MQHIHVHRFITQMIKVPTHKNQQTHFINQENDHVVEIVPPLLATRKINIVLFSVIMQPLLTPMEFLSPVFRHFKRAMKEMLRANTEKSARSNVCQFIHESLTCTFKKLFQRCLGRLYNVMYVRGCVLLSMLRKYPILRIVTVADKKS